MIEIAPEIEPQSTETQHISNTYLNEYGVEDDDEKSEGNELDDVESDFAGTGTDYDEEDSNKGQFRKNKSTLKGTLVDVVFVAFLTLNCGTLTYDKIYFHMIYVISFQKRAEEDICRRTRRPERKTDETGIWETAHHEDI